jgi:4-amino-4-deoxy-L-arabinose transferase-like glycosyltransferase
MHTMPDTTRWTRWLLLLIGIASLVARIAAIPLQEADLRGDEVSYYEIAHNYLMQGDYHCEADLVAYGLEQARPPLLPWILALIMKFTGTNTIALRVALAVLASPLVFATYALARNLGAKPQCALLCSTVAGLHPMLVFYSSRILTEGLFALLTTTAVSLICSWRRCMSWGRPLLTGVVIGLGALCRPTLLPFVLLLPFAWWFSAPARTRWFGLIALVGASTCVLPWEIHLYAKYHAFIPVANTGGFNLWCANNEHMGNIRTEEMRRHLSALSEPARDLYYRDTAWRWARTHPAEFWRARWRCLREFWKPWPSDLWNRHLTLPQGYGLHMPSGSLGVAVLKIAWYGVIDVLLLGAFVEIVLRLGTQRPEMLAILVLLLVFTAIHTLMISFDRYRHPLDPVCFTLGMLWWCRVISRQLPRPRIAS